jgi:hypothetical protein
MKRTRNARYGVGMGLATAAIVTVAAASVLVLTWLPVYQSTRPAQGVGTHVLVEKGLTAHEGDLVVFRDSRHPDEQIGRLAGEEVASSDVVGVVIKHGSLWSLVGYLLALGALVGVPVGLLVGLLVGFGVTSRRRQQPVEEPTAEAEAEPVSELDGDWDAAFEDEGLDLLVRREGAVSEG